MRRGDLGSGFTLVELLTVVIIMAIVFGLVAYSVSRMLPNMQIATASQQLLGAVGQARMMSVTKSAYVKLKLISTGPNNRDTIEILMKHPSDTLGWAGFTRASKTALSQGVKFDNAAEYNFWRDGSVQSAPNTDPVIRCVNRTTTYRTLKVMKATGIAEMR
jgi:prepilin-type N-terminal cleavage/methylation domain-containing protein